MNSMDIIKPVLSLGGLGVTFGVLLGYASKKFAVEVDPRVTNIRECLPGANCGACGYAGCDAYAQAVVDGAAPPNSCAVGGAPVAERIGEILGLKVEAVEKKVAFVKCNGNCNVTKEKYKYYGVQNCRDAAAIPGGGPKTCSYGCLGLGDCVKVCEFGALRVENGVAVVDEEKCTSCGRCVNVCPKGLINIVPVAKKVRVQCNSLDPGKEVRQNCSVGCIGCRMCERACQFGAIDFANNLAKVNYEKCTQCQACVQKCPTKAIKLIVSESDQKVAV
ncbi:RnfABCDGE type electron transport complex subunit B [Fonticella tunisiensis]|uniref:Ion-translocating oxidoreductase complex subunit B n=1 Tax=Fonticella tunisiensis TaxID=1096341 RepID=A0A4R7KQY4_9CLOT|nr:RnfABCDGE type electron transport complex subunit B [Fonticella tunisiensis]TDT61136.1 RnfABCDGE-type electron transport complex B subunit [Fonticella tunisiensis]